MVGPQYSPMEATLQCRRNPMRMTRRGGGRGACHFGPAEPFPARERPSLESGDGLRNRRERLRGFRQRSFDERFFAILLVPENLKQLPAGVPDGAADRA